MARMRCDRCGERFNSEYHLELHQEMDVCNDTESDLPGQSGETASDEVDSAETNDQKHIAEDVTGTVCMYDEDRGFGFLATADITHELSDDTELTEDIFVHISDVIGTDWLEEGDRLALNVVQTEEGLRAESAEVTKRDRDRDSYNEPGDFADGPKLGFGHQGNDIVKNPGYTGPPDDKTDVEGFQDERKFR